MLNLAVVDVPLLPDGISGLGKTEIDVACLAP